MVTITVKLPPDLNAKLNAIVRQRRITKSEAVREAIEKMAADRSAPKASVHDLIGDLCGVVSGPPDLSTNPKYLEGFGLDREQRARLKK